MIDNLHPADMNDIETNDDIGLTLEESEEADRQAASVIQSKTIPFHLEGEKWQKVFSKTVRTGILRFEKALKKLHRKTGMSDGLEREGGKDLKISGGRSSGLGSYQTLCKHCRDKQVVIYPGADGLCADCRKKLKIKGSKTTVI